MSALSEFKITFLITLLFLAERKKALNMFATNFLSLDNEV